MPGGQEGRWARVRLQLEVSPSLSPWELCSVNAPQSWSLLKQGARFLYPSVSFWLQVADPWEGCHLGASISHSSWFPWPVAGIRAGEQPPN